MKKFLLLGLTVLTFVGCNKNQFTSEEGLPADYKDAKASEVAYESNFEKVFGTPSADQTWGFGTASSTAAKASRRANVGIDYPATSEGINANGNEWADPNKTYGGWVVPDPLTAGQIERVRKYFQANPNLSYQDPHWRHFFVQQVYKGGTAVGNNSPETITAANTTTYQSSAMNKLTVGQGNLHMNNYNTADCSTYGNVLDNGSFVNGGTYHSDKIQLMVNIDDTSCFGYYESGASIQVNNKAALVSAATIDAWAAQNGNPGEAVVDKWNRSFMGFDHALKEGAQALDDATVKYNDGPESYSYAMINGSVVSIDGNAEILVNGQPVKYASTNTNMYVAAEKSTLSDGEIQADYRVDGQYMGKYINVDNIMAKLNNGWVPVKDKNLREWVKIGKSDGYFSDWIVTLTEAKRIGDPEETELPSLHVMAEDLSATEASDFDFNDIVFDVFYKNSTTVTVKIFAAGGTLPLRLCENDNWEVHKLFGVDEKCMVNTGTKYHTAKAPYSQATKPYVTLTLTDYTWSNDQNTFAAEVNENIKLEVKKDGIWHELKAEQGKPACKIATPVNIYMEQADWYPEGGEPNGYRWAWEKQNISVLFGEWVKDPNVKWYNTKAAEE